MNLELITEKPLWYGLFCLLAGLAGTYLLYANDNRFSEVHIWLRRLMAAFRFTVITLVAFFLLSPLIRTVSRTTEKPIIVIAQDNSQSVVNSLGKTYLEGPYKAAFDNLTSALKRDYEVKTLSFGDMVTDKDQFSFDDKLTNYSVLFEELNTRYMNRNLAAVILATDGIYNQGSSPLYSYTKIKAPIYPVALGDTTVRKDLILSRVNHNKIAFLGNSFPLEIICNARQCAGQQTILTIEKDSNILISRSITISGNLFHQVVPVFLDAREKGIQHYVVRLSELEGEVNNKNNRTDIFIEIAESKQKVLILAQSAHPDVGAIKNVLEKSQNYEVTYMGAGNFTGNFNGYNLVILHQIPSVEFSTGPFLDKIMNTDASLLYILGSQTAIPAFNRMEAGITISDNGGKTNEVQAGADQNFSLFTLSESMVKNMRTYPPLISPFGVYKNTADNYPLLYQQIGNVATNQPLLLFSTGAKHKNAVLAGEGFWKWRLYEYKETGKQEITDELILKTVQYLSVKEKKNPFRLLHKNNFAENEPLIFNAELYNESQELVNMQDVKIILYNEKKVAYPFTFSKSEKAYTLNAGFFPVGNYRYRAETRLGDKNYIENGEFSVSALQLEQAETRADHQLLYALSRKSGGSMVYPDRLEELRELLKKREDIKPVIYSQKKLQDLVHMKWVFFLLMLFLSAEWFLRKRSGAY